MMMLGLHMMGDVPFRTVYIHGLVRDEQGRKMSKSTGNVIDPLELIDSYGADALRFTICSLAGPGRDVKLGASRVQDYRGFITKLWNAARFCEMNMMRPDPGFDPGSVTQPLSRWLLDSANTAIREATDALEAYRFDEYAATCYRFVWHNFCDWFLEFAKPLLTESADPAAAAEIRLVGAHVLGLILRLLHPSVPFVTEELWDRFGYGETCSLIGAEWPAPVPVPGAAEAGAELDWVVRLIGLVRSVRTEMRVPPSKPSPVLLRDAPPEAMGRVDRWIEAIRRLARASEVRLFTGDIPKGAAVAVLDEATVILPLDGVIDLAAERARLAKDRDKLAADADKVARKLDNPDFVSRAKEEVVTENRERLESARSEIARLEAALALLA
jgi:valyl-tRNA synthetase